MGKRKKIKRELWELTEDELSKRWCPLFGDLPYRPKSFVAQQLKEIILKARSNIWNAHYASLQIYPDIHEILSICEDNDLLPFAEDSLLKARNFFSRWEDDILPFIYLYAREIKKTDGTRDLRFPLDSIPGDILRSYSAKWAGINNLVNHEIYSLLAIHEAIKALYRKHIKIVPDDDEMVKKMFFSANQLLKKALEEYAEALWQALRRPIPGKGKAGVRSSLIMW